DMIDGTPIIDIKPYVAYSDAYNEAISGFAPTEPKLLVVKVTDIAQDQFEQMMNSDLFDKKVTPTLTATIDEVQQQLIAADMDYIKALIAQDPRPAYRRDELNSSFVMRYKSVDVSFTQAMIGELHITWIATV
ncbi:MAG: tRNA (N6-threonylcarbamoyladenosine(37)-N6)-methyltransferase TrmO, partial [Psychrobacter sp.]|nr:tRNA (N6-threonylcarbamoyladenosine(37)-N6)-methyltransferase TrmO [Psychrobacter sp.]